jgi:succinylglutamic semialdehyde dehydrogenase
VKAKGHYIAGGWRPGAGRELAAVNPSTGAAEWLGRSATSKEIQLAVAAAHGGARAWADMPFAARAEKIEAVAEEYRQRKPELADAICRQTGKPRWEAAAEVDSMIAKAAISIKACEVRRSASSNEHGSLRFRPIGVLAVLGPFNMPGHLPNGHLMPAVLAGNTVIFKPSEMTPLVGEVMAEIWASADLPMGVFNMVQGAAETGAALATHPDLDGVLFTGSSAAGAAIHRALAGRPEMMLALEMGGNNPLIVWDCADLDAAAHLIVQSAFITSGQRCSCARRLIVPRKSDELIARLTAMMGRIIVGLYTDAREPFMGTVISAAAAKKLLQAQADLKGRSLVEMRADPRCAALLRPGLIDVTDAAPADAEFFGPLLQMIRVDDFDAAVEMANYTEYGLSAGLVSDRAELYEIFQKRIRAGVVNFNRPLTGARSDLPFGGIGLSGSHRPGAYFAADYCSDPVASLQAARAEMPKALGPGFL